ncbi:hypothetical protein AB1Y20_007606 [Prymnesium parvum]|uniref:Uncharacterized protein n=1 Tax=Prymnesium parvum TaxID=97485 RepID=A0AB34IYF9_PRYPA
MAGSREALEVRIFLDPPAEAESSEDELVRCRAALTALSGRLSPRLRRSAWHCEPLELRLAADSAPPHLRARMTCGESVDDEWFVVGLLLQLSSEQRDVSVVVRDGDGEFLLIEAADCLPRWLTPERAHNRVFLRHGAVHILPRAHPLLPDTVPLPLAAALRALTHASPSSRHAAATARILLRTKPLAAGLPAHRTRAALPLAAARLLVARPSLLGAAAASFAEQSADAMGAAAPMARLQPRAQPAVVLRLAFPRGRYAQLLAHPFTPPASFGPLPSTGPLAKAAQLGAKLAFGLELLLQAAEGLPSARQQPERAEAAPRGGEWERFEQCLVARGYYRGEMEGSRLYRQLRQQALAEFASRAAPCEAAWPEREGVWALDALSASPCALPSEEALRRLAEAEAHEADDGEEWMSLDDASLEAALQRHAARGGGGEAGEARRMREVAESVGDFVGAAAGVEGAEVPREREPTVALDAERFLAALARALGEELPPGEARHRKGEGDGPRREEGWEREEAEEGEEDDEEEDSESQDEDSAANGEEDGELKDLMEAMDLELRRKQKDSDFEQVKSEQGGAGSAHPASSDAGADAGEESYEPVDLDFNLVKNLLASYSAQHGLAGPVSNLLGSMGLELPDDQDQQES